MQELYDCRILAHMAWNLVGRVVPLVWEKHESSLPSTRWRLPLSIDQLTKSPLQDWMIWRLPDLSPCLWGTGWSSMEQIDSHLSLSFHSIKFPGDPEPHTMTISYFFCNQMTDFKPTELGGTNSPSCFKRGLCFPLHYLPTDPKGETALDGSTKPSAWSPLGFLEPNPIPVEVLTVPHSSSSWLISIIQVSCYQTYNIFSN